LSIDIGCGSGILSIAALKLGAARALAVDIDPASVKATAENSSANGVLDQVETGLGSVSEVREGEFSFKSGSCRPGKHPGSCDHPAVQRRYG